MDDDPQFLAFAARLLRAVCPQLEVIEMGDGLDALEFLRARRVELILTDFHMPFVDGLRLTAAVRSIDHDVPIIMFSGEDLRSAALAAGANAFVGKATLAAELGDTLRRLGIAPKQRRVPTDTASAETHHSAPPRR